MKRVDSHLRKHATVRLVNPPRLFIFWGVLCERINR
nr:MAG TPA: hypothetical protein [Caudoviricetes sp.]